MYAEAVSKEMMLWHHRENTGVCGDTATLHEEETSLSCVRRALYSAILRSVTQWAGLWGFYRADPSVSMLDQIKAEIHQQKTQMSCQDNSSHKADRSSK